MDQKKRLPGNKAAMKSFKIEYPQKIEEFAKLLQEKTGATINDATLTAENAWRFYNWHQQSHAARHAEMDPKKQKRVLKLLKSTQKEASKIYKELVGPDLGETFQAMVGPDYEKIEEVFSKGILSLTVCLSKERRGKPSVFGLEYGASMFIDLYERKTGTKASITHTDYPVKGGVYSSDIYDILDGWQKLAGRKLTPHGINSLFTRAKKIKARIYPTKAT